MSEKNNEKYTTKGKVVDFDDIDPENARLHRKKRLKSHAKKSGFAALGFVRILIYIAAIILVSFLLSNAIISIVDDVFAFGDETINETIFFPEGTTLKEASEMLEDAGIIDHPSIFRWYAEREYKKSKYYTGQIKSGEISFVYDPNADSDDMQHSTPGSYIQLSKESAEATKPMNYDRIISLISVSTYKPRSSVRVTIPEGFTVDEIIDLLVEKGVGDREKYVDAINNHDYNYRFVKDIKADESRKYRLEGYLFPDTYDFFTDEKEISVINKMLMNFETRFDKLYYDRAQELGMSVDDLIILASILEKEARNPADLPIMSSVFHNRLKSSMRLDSDATVVYLLDERKVVLDNEDLSIDSPYNTRKYKGIPPGAISNPGIEAINAAFYPESTRYYYFLTLTNGNTVYSASEAQHINAKNKARAEGTLPS